MAQVIGRVEAVDRTFAQLVEVEIVALARMLEGAEHEDARSRRGAHHVIDDAGALEQFLGVVALGCFRDRRAGIEAVAVHAALGDAHAGGVGDHGHLVGYLGAVGEGGDHVGLRPHCFAKPSWVVGLR